MADNTHSYKRRLPSLSRKHMIPYLISDHNDRVKDLYSLVKSCQKDHSFTGDIPQRLLFAHGSMRRTSATMKSLVNKAYASVALARSCFIQFGIWLSVCVATLAACWLAYVFTQAHVLYPVFVPFIIPAMFLGIALGHLAIAVVSGLKVRRIVGKMMKYAETGQSTLNIAHGDLSQPIRLAVASSVEHDIPDSDADLIIGSDDEEDTDDEFMIIDEPEEIEPEQDSVDEGEFSFDTAPQEDEGEKLFAPSVSLDEIRIIDEIDIDLDSDYDPDAVVLTMADLLSNRPERTQFQDISDTEAAQRGEETAGQDNNGHPVLDLSNIPTRAQWRAQHSR